MTFPLTFSPALSPLLISIFIPSLKPVTTFASFKCLRFFLGKNVNESRVAAEFYASLRHGNDMGGFLKLYLCVCAVAGTNFYIGRNLDSRFYFKLIGTAAVG